MADKFSRIVDELCKTRAEMTERAMAIGRMGFEPFPPTNLNAIDTQRVFARIEYLNLCEPVCALVRWLEDHNKLHVLADHAKLNAAHRIAKFPYEIPIVPRSSHSEWDLEQLTGQSQFVASARLVVWLAVASEPDHFGFDWLYHQKLLRFLPTVRENKGRIHPLRRVERWIHSAAIAIRDDLKGRELQRDDEDTLDAKRQVPIATQKEIENVRAAIKRGDLRPDADQITIGRMFNLGSQKVKQICDVLREEKVYKVPGRKPRK